MTSSANITADAAPVSVPTITADNAACSGLGCAQELLDTIGMRLYSYNHLQGHSTASAHGLSKHEPHQHPGCAQRLLC